MGSRIIIAIALGLAAVTAQADTNSWTYAGSNPSLRFWDIDTSWSLGSAPSSDDNADFITNAPSKTITIDDFDTSTPGVTNTLTITNLTVGATGGTTNTLYLSNMKAGTLGTSLPLHVFNSLTVTNGGVLQISNSLLRVDGLAGGTFKINGAIRIYNGADVQTTNATIGNDAVLQFALGTNSSPVVVNNNLTVGGTLNVIDGGGFTTNTYALFTYGGTLTTNGLTMGTGPNGYTYAITSTATQVRLNVGYQTVVASFSGSPTTGVEPLAVTNTDISTGLITNRFWNFGDGSTTNTITNPVVHTYTAGTYSVTLTVCGPAGCSTTNKPNYIVVSNAPPVAVFNASPTNGVAPLAVTNTDLSTGLITNRFWNFGDSSTTNTLTNIVVHTYGSGTYTVTLTVCGPGGCSSSTQSNLITAAQLSAFQLWQMQYFNCTDCPQAAGDADPDGDGASNTNEFLAGTVPTNNASVFRIVSVVRSADDIVITWQTAGIRTNAVQAMNAGAGGYTTNNFQNISGPIFISVGGDTTASYVDVGGATNAPTRFYRIRLVTGQVIIDTVGDGIPDSWRAQYFGGNGTTTNASSCASCDPDGDGTQNLQEYLAGTVPTDPASYFHITAITREDDDIRVAWMMGSGKTNALQVTSGETNGSYSTNNFTDIFSVTNTVGSLTNYLDIGGATNIPSQFYRVRLVP